MKYISQAIKEALVKKALSQPGINLKKFASTNNVGYSSLTKWMKKYGNIATAGLVNQKITQQERTQHVLATAALDENALGAYCREHGLYTTQILGWKQALIGRKDDEKNQVLQGELKSLRSENEKLKQELRRKEKALAETAALLVLKKKAALIWGEEEDV